jgi:hypothetical protein
MHQGMGDLDAARVCIAKMQQLQTQLAVAPQQMLLL